MEVGYEPPADLEGDCLQPLVDFDLTGSKELWLMQCPLNQFPEIDGKEIEVKLVKDGLLVGGFEDSSGVSRSRFIALSVMWVLHGPYLACSVCCKKEFDLVSFASQHVGAEVIVPSGAESKMVGKISRRVFLVHYPEPDEVIETTTSKAQQRLAGPLTSSSDQFSIPMQSKPMRSTRSALQYLASNHSSRRRSALSGLIGTLKASKREHSESIGRSNPSASSRKPRSSTTTVSGSSHRSEKSKKKMKCQGVRIVR